MKKLIFLVMFLFIQLIHAEVISNIVIFGDSLSDNGNLYAYMKNKLPPSPPYYNGRFSNGLVWIEYLAKYYFPKYTSDHLLDFAYGGAGIAEEADEVLFTLKREINTYLALTNNKADPNSLYVVWIGANNYLSLPNDIDRSVKEVHEGIIKGLIQLKNAGAKHILIVNIPDLGKTPLSNQYEHKELLSNFTSKHNEALFNSIESLRNNYPEVQWLFFDINQLFNNIIENPQQYGLTNTSGTCYDFNSNMLNSNFIEKISHLKAKQTTNNDNCEGFLFFDPLHPTTAGHLILARAAKQQLDHEGVGV